MSTEDLEPIGDEGDVTPIEETSEEIVEESQPSEPADEGDYDGEEGDEASEAPEYEPNYSFRAGEEEYEMDDRLKAYIKSEEDEAYFRDLAERAHGLDILKEQREQLRQQNMTFEQTEAQRQGAIQQLQQHVNNNEWEPFQKTWNISDDQVLNRAVQIMQLREMPPEDQQAYYANMQAREQNYALQQQNQQLQQQHSQMAMNQRSAELQQTLQQEQFSQAAQQFDERAGYQGAFRDEIIRRGQYYAQVQGKDLPPHVLAQELTTYINPGQTQNAPSQQTVVTQKKPTLPNVRGSSASPVKGGVKSIADIRARAQEFASG